VGLASNDARLPAQADKSRSNSALSFAQTVGQSLLTDRSVGAPIPGKVLPAAVAHTHNYPEVTLCRGNSREQTEDLAETLHDAARLHSEGT